MSLNGDKEKVAELSGGDESPRSSKEKSLTPEEADEHPGSGTATVHVGHPPGRGNWGARRHFGGSHSGPYGMHYGGGGAGVRDNYPTRILLNSELVGAVIGRSGEKIKEITTRTSARVDVKREMVPWCQMSGSTAGGNRGGGGMRGNGGNGREQSQIVFIFGAPESCSHAIREIMAICKKETADVGKDEPNLGLLAEDRFCGRIIGREGKHLNLIREKSGAHIAVSNTPTITLLSLEPQVFSLDRIVTVKGDLEEMCTAEQMVSAKLRACHQQEAMPRFPGGPGFGGGGNMGARMMPHPGDTGYPFAPVMPLVPGGGMQPFFGYPQPYPQGGPMMQNGMPHQLGEVKLDEALYMRIPHVSAGAVIGTDGASIKKIMEETKTYVNVSKVNMEGRADRGETPQRLVTIKGPPANQTKAQWQIFQRVKTSSRQCEMDYPLQDQDINLWTVVRVPRKIVGRIIGKAGKVVHHIQANSGTIINLPKDAEPPDSDFQPVEIYGCFDSTQLALARIRVLVQQAAAQHGMIAYGGPQGAMLSSGPMMFPQMPPHFLNRPPHRGGMGFRRGQGRPMSGPSRHTDYRNEEEIEPSQFSDKEDTPENGSEDQETEKDIPEEKVETVGEE